ncbi:MAG TPA: DUF4214 domain-containing protein [Acidimicrobiales bacterium]|nr:DUF4214 domain-containing protein [Acidimicrobiales bacterium]
MNAADRRPSSVRQRALALALALVLSTTTAVVVAVPGVAGAQTAGDVVYDGSTDRIDGSVYRLYRAFFLREPDADGLLHWIVQARYARYPIAAIADDFTRSPEFRSRYGALDDGGFVDLVYRNVLDRAPDPGGRAYWLDQLRRGMPRGHLMVHFSDSPEFGRKAGAGPFGRRDYRGPAQAAPSAPAGTWAYLDPTADAGRPAGWARCRPVYVVANPTGIPEAERADFLAMLRYALDAISAATDQDWVYVGRTAYRAIDDTSVNRVLGLVTISFMSAPDPNDAAAAWANTVLGRNSSTGTVTYLSGSVNLNATRLVNDLDGEVTPLVATTLMHELGHIAGLDHVADRTQLMSAVYEAPPEPTFEQYRDGDRAGLGRVGSLTTAC